MIVQEERRGDDDDERSPPIGSPRGGRDANGADVDAAISSPKDHQQPDKKKERRSRQSAAADVCPSLLLSFHVAHMYCLQRSLDDDDDAVGGTEDDHRWTKRTQVVLNSIAAKLKAQDDDEAILFTVSIIIHSFIKFFSGSDQGCDSQISRAKVLYTARAQKVASN